VVFPRAVRGVDRFLVSADDVREQSPSVLFTENFGVGQREEERFAYTQRSRAVGIGKACGFGHEAFLSSNMWC
jgi:hypothetical protein